MTTPEGGCQFRNCDSPIAGKGYLICEHDVQQWCYVHMERMRSMMGPRQLVVCAAYVDEEHPEGCGLQGLAEDVYVFEWAKEGMR